MLPRLFALLYASNLLTSIRKNVVDPNLHYVLLNMARQNLDGWDKTSEQRTKLQSESTKTAALAFYGIIKTTFAKS